MRQNVSEAIIAKAAHVHPSQSQRSNAEGLCIIVCTLYSICLLQCVHHEVYVVSAYYSMYSVCFVVHSELKRDLRLKLLSFLLQKSSLLAVFGSQFVFWLLPVCISQESLQNQDLLSVFLSQSVVSTFAFLTAEALASTLELPDNHNTNVWLIISSTINDHMLLVLVIINQAFIIITLLLLFSSPQK